MAPPLPWPFGPHVAGYQVQVNTQDEMLNSNPPNNSAIYSVAYANLAVTLPQHLPSKRSSNLSTSSTSDICSSKLTR